MFTFGRIYKEISEDGSFISCASVVEQDVPLVRARCFCRPYLKSSGQYLVVLLRDQKKKKDTSVDENDENDEGPYFDIFITS